MASDYPAAHSMDTQWFAVDDDGHVALFDTGEAGAAPTDRHGIEDFELEFELYRVGHTSQQLIDIAGYTQPQPYQHMHHFKRLHPHLRTIMFVLDPTPHLERFRREHAALQPATQGLTAVVFEHGIDVADLRALHEFVECRGCYWWVPLGCYHSDDDDEYFFRPTAECGVYRFDHGCENWISGPYGRTAVPLTPMHASQLPRGLRGRAVRFPGRFAETTMFQPAALWQCSSWESGWLALDLKTARPFPAHVGQQRTFYDYNTIDEAPDLPLAPLAFPEEADDS